MSHNLTLSTKSEYFILRQTPTNVTREILASSDIAKAYLDWCEPPNMYGLNYNDVLAALEHYKRTSELYSWIVHNPEYNWGST